MALDSSKASPISDSALDSEEWNRLMEYLYIGWYVTNNRQTEIDESAQSFMLKMSEIGSRHDESEKFRFDKASGAFVLKNEKRDQYIETLADYVNASFFELLADKLTQRDLDEKYHQRVIEEMRNAEYFSLFNETREKYLKQFAEDEIGKLRMAD